MSLTGKERRLLTEIERALSQEDPQYAERIAAFNRIESGGVLPTGAPRIERRVWMLLVAALAVIVLLVSAVIIS